MEKKSEKARERKEITRQNKPARAVLGSRRVWGVCARGRAVVVVVVAAQPQSKAKQREKLGEGEKQIGREGRRRATVMLVRSHEVNRAKSSAAATTGGWHHWPCWFEEHCGVHVTPSERTRDT